jgi:hypothetical protein
MRQFTSSALMVIGAAAVIASASVNRAKDPESPLSIRSYQMWLGSHTNPENRPGNSMYTLAELPLSVVSCISSYLVLTVERTCLTTEPHHRTEMGTWKAPEM